jgi:peroxiredoxin Q/BCP
LTYSHCLNKGKRQEAAMNLEGKKAPDFDLEGSDGKRHRLKDYEGKTVVVYFYPKDDTPG